jgi:O-antigen/teichoic acid export membrane protein
MNFAGWNLFGNASIMAMTQGINIVLNLFVGPLANAAWAISFQLGNAVSSFSNNIRMAVNPQIVKSHSSGDDDYMKFLVFESAKYSFFLLLLITLPVLLETENVLDIWLEDIPAYTILFCQLILINALIQSFDTSFGMIFQAVGKIKENQLFSGATYFLVLPISYLFLKFNYKPQIVFYIQIVSTVLVAFVVKIYLLRKIVNISFLEYSKNLLFPVFKVFSVAIIFPFLIRYNMPEGISRFIIVLLVSFLSVITAVFYLGIKKSTRYKVKRRLSIEYNKLIN